MSNFAGRVAVITGGAGDIGSTIARRFAQRGATVLVVDSRADQAEAVASRLSAAGLRVFALAVDATDPDAVRDCLAWAHDQHGGPDILVTCAGVLRDRPIGQMTDDDWSSVIGSHLTGTFNFARAAQSYMVEKRFGRMVFFSSDSARGVVKQANYAAAKAGIEGMTRTLSLELGPHGVNVNAVAPGFVDTSMTRATAVAAGRDPDEFLRDIASRNAVGRVAYPLDVSWVVEFLASREARMVTGQVLSIRGAP